MAKEIDKKTESIAHDSIVHMRNSLIQHGKWNDRIYLMHLGTTDVPEIIDDILKLGRQNSYGKIFAKIPASAGQAFQNAGFCVEARIPRGLINGEDLLFVSLFCKKARAVHRDAAQCQEVLNGLQDSSNNQPIPLLPNGWKMETLGPQDASDMAHIYSEVFLSYPFPIDSPSYIREIMAEKSGVFFGIRDAERNLVALSSSEINTLLSIAEMTDFATLPYIRGRHCAGNLLSVMEHDAVAHGVVTAFTIARASSASMNRVFARAGYQYGGTLKQNTNIGGDLEDMNVWYRYLNN
ncbi:MAG: putative beta-lysine N-acetyltransferase [Fibrobacter sp.]|nr:putative beta-lysine N-acetyltransferase [Fibrobacter sp.]